jgi:hypothetical protein
MLPHIRPQIAHGLDPVSDVPKSERLRVHVSALDLVPGTRCRDRCAGLGPNRVRGGERRAISVSSRVDQYSPAAVGLAELLRESVGIARDEYCADGVCKPLDGPEVRLGIEWHDDMKAF